VGDGNSQRGESGKLLGTWRDDKLFIRFCRADVEDEDAQACPKYGPELDYVVQRGDRVDWYQDAGSMGYTKYVEMQRSAEKGGSKVSKECKEGD
jgi:hypothetical protein